MKRKKGFPKTVYLVGAGPGAGVTHTGILLAEYLEERRGARTLFLEVNSHKDICCVKKEILSADYRCLQDENWEEQQIEGYDYVVADLGTDIRFWQKGLSNQAIGILIGNGAPWRQERFFRAVQGVKSQRTEFTWRGLLSLGSEKEAKSLTRKLGIPIYALGWQPLYKSLSEANEVLFLSLIQEREITT